MPPAAEPISLADAKTHLRVDAALTEDDALITLLVSAVRQYSPDGREDPIDFNVHRSAGEVIVGPF